MFIDAKRPREYSECLYFQFFNQTQSEYYGKIGSFPMRLLLWTTKSINKTTILII